MRRAVRGALAVLALLTGLLFLAHHDFVAELPDSAPATHASHSETDAPGAGAAHTAPGAHTAPAAHASHGEAGAGGCADTGAPCWSAQNELALPAPAIVPSEILPAPPAPAATRPDPWREPLPSPPDLAELSVLRI